MAILDFAILLLIVSLVGLAVALVGSIWLLIEAFKESPLWGIGCLVIPLVALVFVVMHWDRTAKPFGINIGGLALMFVGSLLSSAGGGPPGN